MTSVVSPTERGLFWRTVWSPAATLVILYGIAQAVTDFNHAILENAPEGVDADPAEWARRQILLDQLIFNGGDPEDPDQFKAMMERAILYGGVTLLALARALNLEPSTLNKWADGDGSTPKKNRARYIEAIRKIILGV